MSARTKGMGRTVRQQWYGGTEGSPWDSLQSPGTPLSLRQDSGDGKDCETAVVWWD